MDATVIVTAFGDQSWVDLALERAVPSAEAQGVPVILSHGTSVASSRNDGAAKADTEWLIFLDADDELAPGYVEAMARADGDLRAPSVSYVHHGLPDPPLSLADRNIRHLNPCVIGTAVRKTLFERVGGFHDEPIYEDWALWLRCVNAGATIEHVLDAVYLAHVRDGSRNNAETNLRRRTYREIKARLAA